jgi:hypothetical protein
MLAHRPQLSLWAEHAQFDPCVLHGVSIVVEIGELAAHGLAEVCGSTASQTATNPVAL